MLRQLRYGAGDVRLFRIHNDGSGLTELTNISSLVGYAGEVVGAGGPQINSSESKILFEYRSGSDNRIYMMDSNGQNVELVAGPEGSPAAPYWTPKGNFTYSALNSESGRRELYLRNTISGGTSTVIASPDADYNMGILVE
jgi:Tol biopolymer transport system component